MMINVILTESVVLNQIAILMIPDVVGVAAASIHQMTTFQRRAINILMTTLPPEILTLNLEKVGEQVLQGHRHLETRVLPISLVAF